MAGIDDLNNNFTEAGEPTKTTAKKDPLEKEYHEIGIGVIVAAATVSPTARKNDELQKQKKADAALMAPSHPTTLER